MFEICGIIAPSAFIILQEQSMTAMYDISVSTIAKQFGKLEDPRVDRTKLHLLSDILTIALCAVICAADGWVEVANYGLAKHAWLATFLDLPNGIPSHDTFGRVF